MWFLLALALLPFTAAGAPQLSLILNKTETQLGKPVRVEIAAVDAPQAITTLDLGPLRGAFGVVTEESISNVDDPRWPGHAVQLLRLRLYPRRSGALVLPVLQFGAAHSKAQPISVSEGSVGGQPINVVTRLSTSAPWERQQIVLQLEITTPDLFASLEAADTFKAPGFDIVPLARTNEQRQSGAAKVAVLRLGWVLSAQTAGVHNIELPPIHYNLSGRAERTYYFSSTRVQVRALPPYIPPTLPVGKVSIDSNLSPAGLLAPGTLAYWTVTVDGETVTPRGLPPILRQVENNDRVRFLATHSERDMHVDADGAHSRVVHRIPFKPLASGRLALPELRLQYFDPDTGRLVRVQLLPPRPWVLSLLWRMVIGAVLCLLALWFCSRLYAFSRRALTLRRERNAALAAIQQASDARALRHALEAVAHAEGFPTNLSLREWTRHWRARYHTGPGLDDLMTRLSRACYGKPTAKEDDTEIKAAFFALYRKNR